MDAYDEWGAEKKKSSVSPQQLCAAIEDALARAAQNGGTLTPCSFRRVWC